jgi:membrane protease YdiL (CAAX protease family)
VKLKTLALSAPLRLIWTLALYIGVNVALLDWLGIGRKVGSASFVVRNAVVALAVFWISVRLLEGKGLREAGLDPRRAPPELAAGFGLGAAIVSAMVGILAGVGAYRIEGLWPLDPGTNRAGWFALTVLGLFLVGFAEEIRNRGILFRLLEQNLGTWVALGLSALAFGFAHWQNPGATWWSSLAIALEGGVLLAGLYAATRSLWLPIGVHWAWNLFEGPVFGTAVSGNSVGALARGGIRARGGASGAGHRRRRRCARCRLDGSSRRGPSSCLGTLPTAAAAAGPGARGAAERRSCRHPGRNVAARDLTTRFLAQGPGDPAASGGARLSSESADVVRGGSPAVAGAVPPAEDDQSAR